MLEGPPAGSIVIVVAAFLFASVLSSDPSLLFQVTVAEADPSVGGAGGGHAIWFRGFADGDGSKTVRLRFSDDAFLRVGEASSLRGTARVTDGPSAGERWVVNVPLSYRGQGSAGVGAGGPKRELSAGSQPDAWVERWLYFDWGEAVMENEQGDRIRLLLRPSNGRFPFQLGRSASGKNQNLGAAGWFHFERVNANGEQFGGIGDFNVDLLPVPAFDASILDPL
ncbi:MAG: hypothetical protein AAFQ82_03075 [Myxococcota bacterium]